MVIVMMISDVNYGGDRDRTDNDDDDGRRDGSDNGCADGGDGYGVEMEVRMLVSAADDDDGANKDMLMTMIVMVVTIVLVTMVVMMVILVIAMVVMTLYIVW